MPTYATINDIIGNTPLVELANLERNHGIQATLLGKLERNNPGGSAKDRVAKSMLDDAEATGKLNTNTVIIEPTSGNTGIGLAMLGAARGYRVVITMPASMSIERVKLMKAYGAEVILTDASTGMAGAVAKAEEIAAENPNSIIAGQFVNPANPKAHEETTGPEIWQQTEGTVDIFVAGIGTGGTITGVGRYLKAQNPNVQIIGVEPASSPLLTEGHAGGHKIQGIGANFVPDTLDVEICDEIIAIENEDAFAYGREIAAADGLLVGISSGAALAAAVQVASRPENAGKTIVALLPDTGERYLSSEMFDI